MKRKYLCDRSHSNGAPPATIFVRLKGSNTVFAACSHHEAHVPWEFYKKIPRRLYEDLKKVTA